MSHTQNAKAAVSRILRWKGWPIVFLIAVALAILDQRDKDIRQDERQRCMEDPSCRYQPPR